MEGELMGTHGGPWMILAAAAVAGLPAQTALADVAGSVSQEGTLEEITVTAEKRSENVQDIPISISVLTADSLHDSGISSTDQLGMLIPSLVITNISRSEERRV